jgi:hypothetical protein
MAQKSPTSRPADEVAGKYQNAMLIYLLLLLALSLWRVRWDFSLKRRQCSFGSSVVAFTYTNATANDERDLPTSRTVSRACVSNERYFLAVVVEHFVAHGRIQRLRVPRSLTTEEFQQTPSLLRSLSMPYAGNRQYADLAA